MLHPSYTDLINVVNSEVEPGEHPVVQSRYSIVLASAKRARQLIEAADPMSGDAGKKPLSEAIQEIYEGKVKIIGDDSTDEEEPMDLEEEDSLKGNLKNGNLSQGTEEKGFSSSGRRKPQRGISAGRPSQTVYGDGFFFINRILQEIL